jgi:hypothetical protein
MVTTTISFNIPRNITYKFHKGIHNFKERIKMLMLINYFVYLAKYKFRPKNASSLLVYM